MCQLSRRCLCLGRQFSWRPRNQSGSGMSTSSFCCSVSLLHSVLSRRRCTHRNSDSTVTNARVFREFFSQLGADHFTLVLGPVIYQNDFEGLGRENRLDALNERSDRATAVVDGITSDSSTVSRWSVTRRRATDDATGASQKSAKSISNRVAETLAY